MPFHDGSTFGSQADAGTIRGDFGVSNSFNLIHGSDSPEAAKRELDLFFQEGEILDWNRASEGWIYDLSGEEPEYYTLDFGSKTKVF